ncbi:MAG: YbgC/FadM family acyl-CoA thioesterase [Legionellaceae bacterium]|nr:YbgC/FadM family acyl-CoA thioesterase [Legionellaceae bacterium]MBP9774929.1 YbgC/FadM family acyl-CoA thioesterase [Legionellaceae bacterium]
MSYRVYFEDTDLMGIVYHARHLYFFERARTEMLREHGFSLTVMAQNNIYFAIREAQVRYHFPAYLDDFLNITTSVANKTACTLQFKQTMYNQNDKLISEATVMTVCVDQALKPRRLPTLFIGE